MIEDLGYELTNLKQADLKELREKLDSYVLWFNHIRCHSTLGYLSPIAYKLKELNQFVYFSVDIPMLINFNKKHQLIYPL